MQVIKIKLKQVTYWSYSARYGFFTTAYLKMEGNLIYIYHKKNAWFSHIINELMPIRYYKGLSEPNRIYFNVLNQLIIVQEASSVKYEIIIKNIEKHRAEIEEFLKEWNSYKKGSGYI